MIQIKECFTNVTSVDESREERIIESRNAVAGPGVQKGWEMIESHYVQDWTQVLFNQYCIFGRAIWHFHIHIRQNCVCFGDFLPTRTLCDAYHEESESR